MEQSKRLDLVNAKRDLYLVKVPKYISSVWENAPNDVDVGKLKILREPNQGTQMFFNFSEQILKSQELEEHLNREYELNVTEQNENQQNLGVFSCNEMKDGKESYNQLAMEGTIFQKLEFKPSALNNYMKFKLESFKKASIPVRVTKQLDKIVHTFKPSSKQKHNINSKSSEVKRVKADKDVVLEKLYSAFEKHQYYNIKDLVNLTQQPVTYLKEILREICSYNLKLPHRNTWELKREYRHYKNEVKDTV